MKYIYGLSIDIAYEYEAKRLQIFLQTYKSL